MIMEKKRCLFCSEIVPIEQKVSMSAIWAATAHREVITVY